MPQSTPEGDSSVPRFIVRLLDWWQRTSELNSLPRDQLERIASELGMTGSELEGLNNKGPHAADLLYQRMSILGLSRLDVDQIADGLMRNLEKDCSYCSESGRCSQDLMSSPNDDAWRSYCRNAISLESIQDAKKKISMSR